MAKKSSVPSSPLRSYWQTELDKSHKRYRTFLTNGETVVDQYRLQRSDENDVNNTDKYNILYSSTETIRPNLYAKTPKVMVELRHKDRTSETARDAVALLNNCLQYVVSDEDFDEVMENAVEDVLLPGLGQAWVRYEPTIEETKDDKGDVTSEELLDEKVCIDYVYWKDFRTGLTRTWKTNPWVARRCWLTEDKATKYFGKEKAAKLSYTTSTPTKEDADGHSECAEIWEIWDKDTRRALWYCESYPDEMLKIEEDPLKLKDFFPCPRPLRAISNTRTFVPRALYSQYKSQAMTLNTMTRRIRLLTEALVVVGVYDGSQEKLKDLLNTSNGNRMIAVDSWAAFAQSGGIKGVVEWLPLDAIVSCLTQLIQAREVAKAEIYEITGFSDIVRGVSKASETLGAQNIKADWAGARVKKMQKDVQRFARDLIALAGEVIAEHCSMETLALFGGIEIPSQEQMQTPEAQQAFQRFKAAVDLLKTENRRVALVDIETDSTILADEAAEREDRMAFLGAAGAFLQQAVPAMEAAPELGPLLGAMLMFTVRTFPSSRPIEEQFRKVERAMANRPPKPPEDNGNAAKAQAATGVAQIRAQTEGQRIQMDAQSAQQTLQAKQQQDQAELGLKQTQEQNRNAEAMAKMQMEAQFKERELALREREVAVKEAELGIKQQAQQLDKTEAAHAAQVDDATLALAASTAQDDARRQDEQQDHGQNMDYAADEREYDKMDREDARAKEKPLTPKKP